MTKKVSIGLDIGIASVGWALTDNKDLTIIKHGVRLFDTVDSPKDSKLANEKRREARSARRQVNRRRTLRRDFWYFLIKQKMIDVTFDREGTFVQESLAKYINNNDFASLDKETKGLAIFHLRKKGMKEKLGNKELIRVLYWYINHRGFKYKVADSKEGKSREDKALIKSIGEHKFPVDAQLSHYQTNGAITGTHVNRWFHSDDYVREIKEMFTKQGLSPAFEIRFLELFTRQRSFEQGPGSAKAYASLKNISPFSRFFINPETGKLDSHDTIWSKTIGKCSLYKDENRAPKMSVSAQLFNLLNQLNNINVNSEKLSTGLKMELIRIAFETNANSKQIMNAIMSENQLDDWDHIKGYPIDKSDKPKFTSFEAFHAINSAFGKTLSMDDLFIDNKFKDDNLLDKIALILSKTTLVETREEKLKELPDLDPKLIPEIAKISKSFSKTHAFSFKALNQLISWMIVESKEQMTLIQEHNLGEDKYDLKKSKYLTKGWIEEVIDTPTVKRALRQSINLLNALFDYSQKNDLDVQDIVIEMARDNKNQSEKDNEKSRQEYHEKLNKIVDDKVASWSHVSNTTRRKVWLLDQQGGLDAYTGDPIDLEDLEHNQKDYDIDHVIPYSQSYDNSMNNKVLTLKTVNSLKGQKTPWQFFKENSKYGEGHFQKMSKLWISWYSKSQNTNERKPFVAQKKLDYLTTKVDFSNPENQIGFIQRNLVDTRYTTRSLVEYLNQFKETNNRDYKVKTINGKMTSFARNRLENKKNGQTLNRPIGVPSDHFDEKGKKIRIWNGHHAEDAYLITVLNSHYRDSKAVEKIMGNPTIRRDVLENRDSMSSVKFSSNFSELEASLEKAGEELNTKMNYVTFSRMVIKRQNVQLFNESLYESKYIDENKLQKIEKLTLVEIENKKAKKLFDFPEYDFGKSDVIAAIYDPNLFKSLQEIYQLWKENKFPFKAALDDLNKKRVESGNGEAPLSAIEVLGKKGQTRVVKVIRVNSSQKNRNEVIIAPNNKNSFYESMNWLWIEVYKNEKGKFKLLPRNALNTKVTTKGWVTKETAYKEQKVALGIDPDAKMIEKLYRGSTLMSPRGNLYQVVGQSAQQDKLELKPIFKVQRERKYSTINTALVDYQLVFVDYIGEIRGKKELF